MGEMDLMCIQKIFHVKKWVSACDKNKNGSLVKCREGRK
jgi:hypothetical protein